MFSYSSTQPREGTSTLYLNFWHSNKCWQQNEFWWRIAGQQNEPEVCPKDERLQNNSQGAFLTALVCSLCHPRSSFSETTVMMTMVRHGTTFLTFLTFTWELPSSASRRLGNLRDLHVLARWQPFGHSKAIASSRMPWMSATHAPCQPKTNITTTSCSRPQDSHCATPPNCCSPPGQWSEAHHHQWSICKDASSKSSGSHFHISSECVDGNNSVERKCLSAHPIQSRMNTKKDLDAALGKGWHIQVPNNFVEEQAWVRKNK